MNSEGKELAAESGAIDEFVINAKMAAELCIVPQCQANDTDVPGP